MIIGNYEKVCKNYELCDGYEKALNSSEEYLLHHIQGEKISREELKEQDLYYDCEPENLRWVTWSEHMKIHMTGENNYNFGKSHKGVSGPNFGKKHSAETRKKMSEAHKGKELSNETKQKISEAQKGNPSTKGMTWKLVNGKRIYSDRINSIKE